MRRLATRANERMSQRENGAWNGDGHGSTRCMLYRARSRRMALEFKCLLHWIAYGEAINILANLAAPK